MPRYLHSGSEGSSQDSQVSPSRVQVSAVSQAWWPPTIRRPGIGVAVMVTVTVDVTVEVVVKNVVDVSVRVSVKVANIIDVDIDVSVKDNCTLEASLINFYTATWINLRTRHIGAKSFN